MDVRIIQLLLQRNHTYNFHEFIFLLAIGFTFIHIAVLTLDHHLPFTLGQILIPFTATYRPFWVGIGVLAFCFSCSLPSLTRRPLPAMTSHEYFPRFLGKPWKIQSFGVGFLFAIEYNSN